MVRRQTRHGCFAIIRQFAYLTVIRDESNRVWVKICGIRDADTASQIGDLGPDAIGVNFYAASPRAVTIDMAETIVARLPTHVEAVALFVNHPIADIVAACRACAFQTVQLHGDEPPEFLAQISEVLPSVRVIRAFRFGIQGIAPLSRYIDECRALDTLPFACLVDADVKGAYGGTGHTVCWDRLREELSSDDWPRLILAGGLRPDNVVAAIRAVQPWGVDTASGVEVAPGEKDLALVRRFLDEARGAFESLPES